MAKIVVAGRADCPYYAKAELLGDKLTMNLPEFRIHKIVLAPEKWKEFLEQTCHSHNWRYEGCPIVWRELIDRGGKGVLIGGCNEFLEYAKGYYDSDIDFSSSHLESMAEENLSWKEETDKEEKYIESLCDPLRVCVTCATSCVARNTISDISRGKCFRDAEIHLKLLDDEDKLGELSGVAMDAIDMAGDTIRKVSYTSDSNEAFSASDYIILLEGIAESAEVDKEETLKKNYAIYGELADSLSLNALNNCRIVVAGEGPVNFNAFVLSERLKNFPDNNIVALSGVLENRARNIICSKLKAHSGTISNIVVWGNSSNHGSKIIDSSNAQVYKYDSAIWGPYPFRRPCLEMLFDLKWFQTSFENEVINRGKEIREKMGHGCLDLVRSRSISSLLHNWSQGASKDEFFSLGVRLKGWYGMSDVYYSIPVTFSDGSWFPVLDHQTDAIKKRMEDCYKELLDETYFMYPDKRPPFPKKEDDMKDVIEDVKPVNDTSEQSMTSESKDQLPPESNESEDNAAGATLHRIEEEKEEDLSDALPNDKKNEGYDKLLDTEISSERVSENEKKHDEDGNRSPVLD